MTLRTGERAQYLYVTQGSDNFFRVFGVSRTPNKALIAGIALASQRLRL
jgi:hypothetical protein